MAGNFVPRLPTWNTTVINWIFDPLTGTRSLGSGFSAQMYPPFRTSDNPGPSDGYLVFPKSVTEIHDPTEYNNAGMDAVVFNWQGNDFGWKVIQLLPRWMNFPNEHWLALLQRMTAAELADIANAPSLLLPNFNVATSIYHVETGVTGATLKGTSQAQLYYQKLTHHSDTYTSLFCLMPSNVWTFVDDDGQYLGPPQGYDVIEAEWPTGSGRLRQWRVGTCEPRQLGELGEHIAICMEPLTIAERVQWFSGSLPDAGTSTISASPVTVLNDGVATTTISGTMLTAASAPVVGATVVISSSGSAMTASSPITDASGNWSTTATDITAESVTFSAVCLGVTVGPSNSVTFGSYPAHLSTPADVTTGNGTCSNCADLNAGFTLDAIDSVTWQSAPFSLTCITSAGNAQWLATISSGGGHLTMSVQLYDVDTNLPILSWTNTNIDSWDGASALTLPYVGGSAAAACAWNDPITMTPS